MPIIATMFNPKTMEKPLLWMAADYSGSVIAFAEYVKVFLPGIIVIAIFGFIMLKEKCIYGSVSGKVISIKKYKFERAHILTLIQGIITVLAGVLIIVTGATAGYSKMNYSIGSDAFEILFYVAFFAFVSVLALIIYIIVNKTKGGKITLSEILAAVRNVCYVPVMAVLYGVYNIGANIEFVYEEIYKECDYSIYINSHWNIVNIWYAVSLVLMVYIVFWGIGKIISKVVEHK